MTDLSSADIWILRLAALELLNQDPANLNKDQILKACSRVEQFAYPQDDTVLNIRLVR